MVINEKGLCAAMKAAYKKKSTGYKVAARISEDGAEEIVLSAPGWTAIITRGNAPRKVMALIVEHVGDLPQAGQAFQVQDSNSQAEIFDMAVPPKLEELAAGAVVKRTQLNYNGYQIWQRVDDHTVFMMPPKHEDMLDSYNRQVKVMDNGALFYTEGIASRLYLQPLSVQQNELTALHHLAKLQWV